MRPNLAHSRIVEAWRPADLICIPDVETMGLQISIRGIELPEYLYSETVAPYFSEEPDISIDEVTMISLRCSICFATKEITMGRVESLQF
jgi:hypothetical protein